ncbi:hypothetical protein ACTHGU_01330 [Chitinophagaceae bacterium MMS25-I14]
MATYVLKNTKTRISADDSWDLVKQMNKLSAMPAESLNQFMNEYARRIMNRQGKVISTNDINLFVTHLMQIGEIEQVA